MWMTRWWMCLAHTFSETPEEPDVVSDEVGHGGVQTLQHAQHIVHIEHGVVIPIQHPLVAVCS